MKKKTQRLSSKKDGAERVELLWLYRELREADNRGDSRLVNSIAKIIKRKERES
jgi:hypothetical protein